MTILDRSKISELLAVSRKEITADDSSAGGFAVQL